MQSFLQAHLVQRVEPVQDGRAGREVAIAQRREAGSAQAQQQQPGCTEEDDTPNTFHRHGGLLSAAPPAPTAASRRYFCAALCSRALVQGKTTPRTMPKMMANRNEVSQSIVPAPCQTQSHRKVTTTVTISVVANVMAKPMTYCL